ncbi:SRPBCC family protein [Riemerella anatipestifer]|uniref:SRPBCC family protein n=1 Tax=Riemerella anatipestifer TaxID=34085 RepID=UPI00129EAD35|nr:SRPBCC family protein [Riemerella anatipestifer]MRM83182.1 polyketide cyclase [Riemerella anatipestifer]
MRWLKFILVLGILLSGVYAVSMLFVDESKSFKVEREIDYPIDKVYPQFSNFQNLTRWYQYFTQNPKLKFEYFLPYEGQGSSMNFVDAKKGVGMVFIRYENFEKTLRYEFFDADTNAPLKVDIKFLPKGKKTRLIWVVTTPKKTLLNRYVNLFSVENFEGMVDESLRNLKAVLSNKVDKIEILTNIKYDSLMIENQEAAVLVGINANTQNKNKTIYFKDLVKNHHKVVNFVMNDLGKKEDEFGFPMLITQAKSYKDKEVSYFYGIPLSKKSEITDNNFTYHMQDASRLYVMYYKGDYANRVSVINKLLKKAEEDSLRTGKLQEVFIETPVENKPVLLKIALPVSS